MNAATTLIALIAGLALAAGLAGCGKKSNLEAPPGEASQFPHPYPKPEAPRFAPPQGPQSPAAPPPPDERMQLQPPLQNRILPQ